MKFLPALQILFIGLKLTDNIDWNWFLVLSPFLFQGTLVFLDFILEITIKFLERKDGKKKI